MFIWRIEQFHVQVWTGSYASLNRFLCMFEQVHVQVWTSSIAGLNRFMCRFEQVHVHILTGSCVSLNRFMCRFEQVHVQVWTCSCAGLNRFICRFKQVQLQVWTGSCAGSSRFMFRFVVRNFTRSDINHVKYGQTFIEGLRTQFKTHRRPLLQHNQVDLRVLKYVPIKDGHLVLLVIPKSLIWNKHSDVLRMNSSET